MDEEELIFGLLEKQERGIEFDAHEHEILIGLLRDGKIGIDGFKFCTVEDAARNRAIMLRVSRGQITF